MKLIIDRKLYLIFNQEMIYQDYLWVTSYLKSDLVYPVIANKEHFY